MDNSQIISHDDRITFVTDNEDENENEVDGSSNNNKPDGRNGFGQTKTANYVDYLKSNPVTDRIEELLESRYGSWWRSMSNLEQYLIISITLISFLIFIMALLLIFGTTGLSSNVDGVKVNEALSDVDTICTTPGCISAAADIIENIDETVAPCEDFYQFACGGWLDKHDTGQERTTIFTDEQILKKNQRRIRHLLQERPKPDEPGWMTKIKHMYRSCMNLDAIEKAGDEPILRLIDKLGGWPVLAGKSWKESKFNWEDVYVKIANRGLPNQLFSFRVDRDFEDHNKMAIYVHQSVMWAQISYLKYGLNHTRISAYFKLMTDMAVNLGASRKTAEKDMLNVLKYEAKIANASYTTVREAIIGGRGANRFTIDQLQQIMPSTNWRKIFNGIFGEDALADDGRIILTNINYFVMMDRIMNETNKRIVANSLVGYAALQSIRALSSKWEPLIEEYQSTISQTRTKRPRWIQCLQHTQYLSTGISAMFVKKHYQDRTRENVDRLLEYLRGEMRSSIKQGEWMDNLSRRMAIDKLNALKFLVGYPPEQLTDDRLEDFYSTLEMRPDAYFDNLISLYGFVRRRRLVERLKMSTKPGNIDLLSAVAFWPMGFYSNSENELIFPAGIFQDNFYDDDRPHYLNYGAVGFRLGHELTHGFDAKGQLFNKDGDQENWWTLTTREQFQNRAQCFVKQYRNYIAHPTLTINGERTRDENIADQGGLKLSYMAYKQYELEQGAQEPLLPALNYTRDQLFFISFAQSLCMIMEPRVAQAVLNRGMKAPNKFRAIGSLANLPQFSQTFNCSSVTLMNPADRCNIW